MILPEFVFVNSKELPFEILLHTAPPYMAARAIIFDNSKMMEDFIKKYNLLNAAAIVAGYNILICKLGTLDRVQDAPVLGHNITALDLKILNWMQLFYEKERIRGNESRMKKYAR